MTASTRIRSEQECCPYMGAYATSRGVVFGQFCRHPANLDAKGRLRLDSLNCGEWDVCPRTRDQLQHVYR